MLHPCKFSENPPTGSWDIVQTIKCHADADANANANADANRIRTKNNISPSPPWGTWFHFSGQPQRRVDKIFSIKWRHDKVMCLTRILKVSRQCTYHPQRHSTRGISLYQGCLWRVVRCSHKWDTLIREVLWGIEGEILEFLLCFSMK